MTKQEKIREWLAEKRYYARTLPMVNIKWEDLTPFAKECWFHLADDDLSYLDSQGVAFVYDIQAPAFGKQWAKFKPLIEEGGDYI